MRFPGPTIDPRLAQCPLCDAPTELLRDIPALSIPDPSPVTNHIVGVLDNLRSALNTGTIIRAADGAGLAHLHLCGYTPTPENPKVAKTSLGSEHAVGWTHHFDALDLARQLKADGYELWALEATLHSVPLFDQQAPGPDTKLAFIVGNEVAGVDPDLLDIADRVVALPMHGTKTSLNVGVAFGIAAYWLGFSSPR